VSKESKRPWELDFTTAEREFARAWFNPAYTQSELESIDVNRVLRESYALSQPLTFTRAMLWDVEVRKARDPQRGDGRQPLFHVEHAVGGTEAQPLNLWRIVHLTHGRDQRLIDRFAALDDARALPEFIELYIRRDLDIALSRREPAPLEPHR
jgi:hypothetical protein